MSKSKPRSEAPAPNAQPKKRPERKIGPFNAGIGVCIWLNTIETDQGPRTVRSISINPRRYFDREAQQWKDSGSYNPAPDAGLLLSCKGAKKVFYLEQDRATSGVQQIATGKTGGYAAMAQHKLHQRHFAEENVGTFSVLMIAPTDRRRDALRHAIKDKPGAALWRFACAADVTPEKVLFHPIWYPCAKEDPDPLIRGAQ